MFSVFRESTVTSVSVVSSGPDGDLKNKFGEYKLKGNLC